MSFLSRIFGRVPAVAEIDVPATAAALKDGTAQVVDCRMEREWSSGHIKGSTLIPLGSIESHLNELDRERPVIVVCRSGHRSSIAARQLISAGFVDVKSMKGGINAWSRTGNTLVSS
ncbi:MAG: rhodanese-like domain-containing protein [Thermomicrobiales bacterium]|nr:rhodanese-like domain-containing protein [Thermomicrobiales bacterium]MCO5220798.1 rhodanese-like domain-containing protein [Thermomicrobiales bacterium]